MDFLKSSNTLPFSQIYTAVSPVDRMSHLSLLITYGAKDHSCILSQMFCDNYDLFSSDAIKSLIKWAIHDIRHIEPSNAHTIPYNIFDSIDRTTDINEKYENLEQLAYMLMPESERMDDNARFFLTEGRKILTAALIAFYFQGMDFIQICEFIIRNSFQNLFSAIDNSHCEAAIQYINSFQGANEKNTAGCKQAADNAVKLFATNSKIKKCIHRPVKHELYFCAASVEHSNVFVIIDDVQLELYII